MTPESDLTRRLDAASAPYELVHHAPAETARAEARAVAAPPDEVAKIVVLLTPAGCVRAVVASDARVDVHKVRDLLEDSVRLATEDELRSLYPEFELGAVPPFGGARRETVLLDLALMDHESVVFAAGTQVESIRMTPGDLARVSGARVVDIGAED